MNGRVRAGAALAAVVASSLGTASPVLAQPRGGAASQQVASDLVNQAIAKSESGDHLAAIDLYLQAYALIPNHTLLSNVGSEYQKADKPVEALRYFCMYLDKDPTGTNASYATAKAKALQIELGNTEVDADDVCRTPAPKRDKREGAGGGAVTAPVAPASKPGRTLKLVGIGIGGAGLVVAGVGVVFGFKAKSISDEITNHPANEPWDSDIEKREKDGQTYEDRQIQLMVAGGVLAATGVVLFVVGATRGGEQRSEQISVRPLASQTTLGIALGGGF